MLKIQRYAVSYNPSWGKRRVESVHYSKEAAKERANELMDRELGGGNSYACVKVEPCTMI
jgi:hypothetical protein